MSSQQIKHRLRRIAEIHKKTEATATKALQEWFYHGVGKKFLGFHIADEIEQPDGSWKKDGKDGFRHWTVPIDADSRRKWRPFFEHLKGLHRGVVSLGSVHVPFVSADFDRHTESVDPQNHIWRVLRAGRLLRRHFSQFCWIAEVNPRNGSMKYFGFGKSPIPIDEAQKFATQIHELLQKHECEPSDHRGKRKLEVFPLNCVQVGLPMRMDKVTLVSSGVLAKCIRKKKGTEGRRVNFETYSALAFIKEIRQRASFHENTLFRELKKASANLPFVPATEVVVPVPTVPKKRSNDVGLLADLPSAKGDYWDNENSYERQQDGLMELCRKIGRVATDEEGLQFIRDNQLFSGDWSQNEIHREHRVAYLLNRIALTFDRSKCGSNGQSKPNPLDIWKINVGKYDNWAKHFIGKVTGRRRTVDEYGNVVERRSSTVDWKWVSVFLSVVEYCCVTSPNEDGTLPHDRAEKVWLKLHEMGRISCKWDDRKWKVARDWLETMKIIRILDRNWVFAHGDGKAMKWAVGSCFEHLHVWWKTVKESSGNEAIPLNVFLGYMLHTASLNTCSQSENPEIPISLPESTLRDPPW